MVDLHNELLHQVPFDFLPEIDTAKVIAFFRRGADDRTDIDSYNVKTRPAPPLAEERKDD